MQIYELMVDCARKSLLLHPKNSILLILNIKKRQKTWFFPTVTLLLCIAAALASCTANRQEKVVTPWGEITDTIPDDDDFDLDQIVANGEMIVATISGPATYYDHRGRQLGLQYMLVQRFAEKIGVGVRVELCRDTLEMVRKLIAGDVDILAYPLKKSDIMLPDDSVKNIVFCGAGNDSIGQWTVNREKAKLSKSLDEWYEPKLMAEVKKEEDFLLSTRSVVRHVYAPMLNKKGGVISHYDALFMTYCQPIRWDWRLMAAQCYQESTFDPQARSWAGALGLMQIMPATADMLGLPREKIHDPESNIAAAAKYLGQLETKFSDIPSRYEKMNFVLGSYNGGYHHIRDAMALTEKYGGNPRSWNDVSQYVLKLSNPQFYRDPVVKYGYMRGSETEDYVRKIRQRWETYKGVKSPRTGYSNMMPQKAKKHKKKYDV